MGDSSASAGRVLSPDQPASDVDTCGLARPKSRKLGPVRGQKNVRGLDVTVDETVAVSGGEAVRRRDGDIQERMHIQRSTPQPLLQRLAFEQLHCDVRRRRDTDVVDCADVRMVEDSHAVRASRWRRSIAGMDEVNLSARTLIATGR